MKYCKRCLYPANHPLNITFDLEGVCSGCRIHEEKDALDWQEREKKLERLFQQYRCKSQNNFDCVVPVSGARDSYFIVHTVRNVYKMNPLLVSYNKHYNTNVGIRNLAYLRTVFDCDIMTMNLSPEVVKKVTRHTLKKMGSMYWHCLAGSTVFPVQVAVRFRIPLIVWGVHQGCDQVGMFSHLDEVEMTRKYRKEHDLIGFEAEDLIDGTNGLSEEDVKSYFYPHDKDIDAVGVRGIYLSNYIRWDTKRQHELMIDSYGYETGPQQRTFDTYNDVDCFHYSGTHDYLKFLKYGYGKATDHACREIRLKRLTREEGIDLVEQYERKQPEDLGLLLKWLGMNEREFYACVDEQRDPRIWEKSNGQWTLLDSVVKHRNDEGVDPVRLSKKENCEFVITPPRGTVEEKKEYTVIGKGYVDDLF